MRLAGFEPASSCFVDRRSDSADLQAHEWYGRRESNPQNSGSRPETYTRFRHVRKMVGAGGVEPMPIGSAFTARCLAMRPYIATPLAPVTGLEPVALRLTAERTAIVLHRNKLER